MVIWAKERWEGEGDGREGGGRVELEGGKVEGRRVRREVLAANGERVVSGMMSIR